MMMMTNSNSRPLVLSEMPPSPAAESGHWTDKPGFPGDAIPAVAACLSAGGAVFLGGWEDDGSDAFLVLAPAEIALLRMEEGICHE